MRIVSYTSSRGMRAGILSGDRVIDAWDAIEQTGGSAPSEQTAGIAPSQQPASVRRLLESELIPMLSSLGGGDGIRAGEVELGPPVPDPDKIICIGLNYRSHAEEAGIELPSTPTFFAKFRNALAPPGAAVALPPASSKVDYEAEVAFVIGRRCSSMNEDEAVGCIAGYTLLNDLSARDLQFATPQWMPGKVFDGSAPCGPALVTPDEAGSHDAIQLSLALNGETMQSASTADLIFSPPALVAHLSTLMTLEPGDIVSTGTPAGVGSVREPRVWLESGDDLVIESPTLGRLETRIA